MASPNHILGHDLLRTLPLDGTGRGTETKLIDTRVMAVVLDGAAHLKDDGWYDLEAIGRRLGLDHEQPRDLLVRAVAERLYAELEDQNLLHIYDLECRCIVPTIGMMETGVGIDVPGWNALVDHRAERRESNLQLLHDNGIESLDDLLVVLDRRGIKVNGTTKADLRPHADDPLLDAFLEARSDRAFLNDLGPKILEHVDVHNRVRGCLDPLGTTTGRYTCKAPNLLGFESDEQVRELIVAAPGNVLIACDYSQADLRVLASLTRDPALVGAYLQGRDVHEITASALFSKAANDVSKPERTVGKAINFASVFGAEPSGLRTFAAASYGLQLSFEDAQTFACLYSLRYPVVSEWQKKISKVAATEAFSLYGRKRSGLDTTTKRLNAPVQMSTSDALKLAIAMLDVPLLELGAQIILPVHDELLIEAPKDKAREVADLVESMMTRAMEYVIGDVVPVAVSTKIGPGWGKASS